MDDRTIDLRNKEVIEAEIEEQPLPATRKKELSLEWSSHEYEKKERGTSWHMAIAAVALALVVVGIMTRSYFFIAFVALAYATFLMYEKRAPVEISFAVNGEGVQVGKKLYHFSELKSFWIFRKANPQELSLHTDHTLFPYIRIPLRNVDAERLRMLLRNSLPEEEHQEFITDHIDRAL